MGGAALIISGRGWAPACGIGHRFDGVTYYSVAENNAAFRHFLKVRSEVEAAVKRPVFSTDVDPRQLIDTRFVPAAAK